MQSHAVVSRQEWLAARMAHLALEKEYTKARERQRRAPRAAMGQGRQELRV